MLGGQAYLPDPTRFWNHDSPYVGSAACGTCHARIHSRQISSNHARSLRLAHEVPQLADGLPVRLEDRASDSTVTLLRAESGRIGLQAEKDGQASRATLEWAFGSGLKGITPIGITGGGDWIESRLTWYASLPGIEFTTGSSQRDPSNARESLGRPLTRAEVAECFSCHTTGYDSSRSAPARDEMGILCERCHGPGLQHVEAAANRGPIQDTIFNPGTLAGFPQAQLCGACHGTPPLDNDFDALSLLERTPHSVRFPSQRLMLSRCFNETFGNLACTTCHDPHGDVAEEAATFDASCLACHDRSEREPAEICPIAVSACSSCHMPKERVMRHSMFSDHWIRVVRSQ